MKKKVKVGIIGMGGIGTIHADAYTATGEAEIVGICDIVPEKLKRHGERLGVKNRYEDYRQLLAGEAEAVDVCVGNVLHKEMATAALAAGKHVLLEKPMAMNAREAAAICAAAAKAKGVLQIGMVNRQKRECQVLRSYVEQGLLGEIYQMRAVLIRRRGIPGLGGWFTTKAESGGGPLIDIGVHWFDLAMYLSGLWQPTAVSAKVYAKFGAKMRDYKYVSMWAGPPKWDGVCDVEDYATGLVRFGERATMSFEIAWAANAESESFVEILGDKGGARVMDGKGLRILTENQGYPADLAPLFEGGGNNFEFQARKFLAACRGEGQVACTGQEGLTTMKLIDAIYQSSEQGKEVKI